MTDLYKKNNDRLTTTDEKGNRVYVHPEDLAGLWRDRRHFFYWGLISIYMFLPWIYIDGKQFVQLNIATREFTLFGMTFWAHDTPLMIFLLIGFAFFMAFLTSIWGRAWCGWACPQTVFLDTIFRKIESTIEGHSRKRMKLDQMSWNLEKISKRGLKWLCFTIITLHISHTFLGFFVGTHELLEISLQRPSANWSLFITMIVITAILLFDFGWFREQFCIIICPYGRLQSVMMDSDSLLVSYDEKRGEPRKGFVENNQPTGDCVNCFQCVKVCPTGIDIRLGSQMECIACTACIDACDNIMERLDKPHGLIKYTTENELAGKGRASIWRFRSLAYLALFFVIVGGLFFALNKRNELSVVMLRGRNEPYSIVNSPESKNLILNHFKLELHYPAEKPLNLYFVVNDDLVRQGLQVVTPMKPFKLKSGRKKVAHIFFKFPKRLLKSGSRIIELHIYDGKLEDNGELILIKEVPLAGPY